MSDILTEISDENLPKLAILYEKYASWAPHVSCLLYTAMRWKQCEKFRDRVTFLSPRNSWKTDGTIIVILELHCYDIFVFTLDDHCTNLSQGLAFTNRLDYHKAGLFFCVHKKHLRCIKQLAVDKNLKIHLSEELYHMYALPQAEVTVMCPPEVTLKALDSSAAEEIDEKWPHRFPGSVDYVRDLLKMNGGYGLFLRGTNEMVSWVVKHCFGHLGLLQTEDQHKKKGYAKVVVSALVKEILEEGQRPFATIFPGNKASINFFEKLGFQRIGECAYVNLEQ